MHADTKWIKCCSTAYTAQHTQHSMLKHTTLIVHSISQVLIPQVLHHVH
jgi:hypothetical protein